MDVLQNFDRAAAVAAGLIDKIPADGFGAPTPCTDWDVRAVVNHLVAGNLMADNAARGAPPPDRNADHLGDSPPAETFARTVDEARAAFAAPGVLERVVPTPLGEQPAAFLVHMRINELLVHSWDLAVATGQPTDFEPELCQGVLGVWRQRLSGVDRYQVPFDEEQPVPEDATAADRLAAYLGRRMP
ncbi:TIGR03086 family metal-binding protein [Labedaea rhizosphaerae]|uniref:Uncharacterized protein (TIGR03086 family) n=1 Tax=Labedaea rhizosphaerae TaxID=598644 RepID=A0A4R6RYV6_LABRH|nr:TIGR03086 family metal-binding protein [Labedaea rhizosphaerae]TDP92074.1 uncharacterized protein (TIGR03086 family) [Labedaea rhizosphaerae]